MPISTEIQNKVLKIASNEAVNNKAKLAVRKTFYELKNEEIKVEEVQLEFNEKTAAFNNSLDAMLSQIDALPTVDKEVPIIPEVITPVEDNEEEIILPKKSEQVVSGVKVRMQEEVNGSSGEDDTDFEVPFESDNS